MRKNTAATKCVWCVNARIPGRGGSNRGVALSYAVYALCTGGVAKCALEIGKTRMRRR